MYGDIVSAFASEFGYHQSEPLKIVYKHSEERLRQVNRGHHPTLTIAPNVSQISWIIHTRHRAARYRQS